MYLSVVVLQYLGHIGRDAWPDRAMRLFVPGKTGLNRKQSKKSVIQDIDIKGIVRGIST
jgi:hypothetical protein